MKKLNKTCTSQQRHDILMKFYALMKENTDDLARLIVSDLPNLTSPISEHQTCPSDLGKREASRRSKGASERDSCVEAF